MSSLGIQILVHYRRPSGDLTYPLRAIKIVNLTNFGSTYRDRLPLICKLIPRCWKLLSLVIRPDWPRSKKRWPKFERRSEPVVVPPLRPRAKEGTCQPQPASEFPPLKRNGGPNIRSRKPRKGKR